MFGAPGASLLPESGIGALFVAARRGVTLQESTQTVCIVSPNLNCYEPELLHAQAEA